MLRGGGFAQGRPREGRTQSTESSQSGVCGLQAGMGEGKRAPEGYPGGDCPGKTPSSGMDLERVEQAEKIERIGTELKTIRTAMEQCMAMGEGEFDVSWSPAERP